MRIVVADAITHLSPDGQSVPIYSIDMQPKTRRLLTGGADCKLKLWDLSPYFVIPSDPTLKPTLLATLSSHTKPVNCVRWSTDGEFFASASNDTTISVHKFLGPTAGLNNTNNKENWMRVLLLKDHHMEVLDIDWSPRGILASASIDNMIKLWNVYEANLHESRVLAPFMTLSGHLAVVKGLSFDPIGRFLVSTSCDNVLRVWDGDKQWSMISELREPQMGSADSSLFRRMSWAPDGQSICITACMKDRSPVGCVLNRGDWSQQVNLQGHTTLCAAVRYCPQLLVSPQDDSSDNNDEMPISLVALGDQDGLVTIWSTIYSHPIFTIDNACSGSITDITWLSSPSHVAFVCASITGEVLLVDLGDCAGRVMNSQQLSNHFQTLYGRDLSSLRKNDSLLAANPLLLKYTKDITEAKKKNVQVIPTVVPSQKQVISIRADGRKRIQPVSVVVSTSASVAPPELSAAGIVELPCASSNVVVSPPKFKATTPATKPTPAKSSMIASEPSTTTSSTQPVTSAVREPRKKLRIDTESANPSRSVNSNVDPSRQSMVSSLRTVTEKISLSVHVDGSALTFKASFPSAGLNLSGSLIAPVSKPPRSVTEESSLDNKQTSPWIVTIERLVKPNNFQTMFLSGTGLMHVTLTNEHRPDKPRWTTFVAVDVTCLRACALPSTDSQNLEDLEMACGVVVVGGFDGSIHLLDLYTGFALRSPIIVGASVAFVDCAVDMDTENSVRILAATTTGGVHAWSYNFKTSVLRRLINTTLHPLVESIQSAEAAIIHNTYNKTTSSSSSTNPNVETNSNPLQISVDKCYFMPKTGCVLTYLTCRKSRGGNFHCYSFDTEAEAWVRMADSRFFLSGLFVSSNINPARFTSCSVNQDIWSHVQADMARLSGLSVTDVLAVSKGRIAQPSGLEVDSILGTRTPPELAKFTWIECVTLCHAEDRLLSCISMGQHDDIKNCLRDWISICCQTHLLERIRLFVNQVTSFPISSDTTTPNNKGLSAWITSGQALEALRTVLLPCLAENHRIRGVQNLMEDLSELLN